MCSQPDQTRPTFKDHHVQALPFSLLLVFLGSQVSVRQICESTKPRVPLTPGQGWHCSSLLQQVESLQLLNPGGFYYSFQQELSLYKLVLKESWSSSPGKGGEKCFAWSQRGNLHSQKETAAAFQNLPRSPKCHCWHWLVSCQWKDTIWSSSAALCFSSVRRAEKRMLQDFTALTNVLSQMRNVCLHT